MGNVMRFFEAWCRSHGQPQIDRWRSEYEETGTIVFDDFGSSALFKNIYDEASTLLTSEGQRRDLIMAPTGDTPRKYISVGRNAIFNHDGLIPKLFSSTTLIEFFRSLISKDIYPVDYTPEQYIINRQESSGDTHGWHCDDYEWAFIWVMDAPEPISGGRLEYIPRVSFDNLNPSKSLNDILRTRETRSKWLSAGTAYLMHANDTLHRVTPLSNNQKRTVVVMTFASKEDNTRTMDHSTMDSLYPKDTAVQTI
jgi:hypothetical protein